jgi:hypothetical protein
VSTHLKILKTPEDIVRWVRAITTMHGPLIEHLSYPDDCQKIVEQFKKAGVSLSAHEAQELWYAYCKSLSSGWMSPASDCVGCLDLMVSEIEEGSCLDDSLSRLKGCVQALIEVPQ